MVIVMLRSLDAYVNEAHRFFFLRVFLKKRFVSMKNLSHWWPLHLLLTWPNFSKDTSWSRPLVRSRDVHVDLSMAAISGPFCTM